MAIGRCGGARAPRASKRGWRRAPWHLAALAATASVIVATVTALAAPAAATASTIPAASRAAAQAPVTLYCAASVGGTNNIDAGTQTPTVAVSAPSSIPKGQNYTVTIAPSQETIPTTASGFALSNISNFVFRYAIPDGATYVSAVVNGDGQGSYGGQPAVATGTSNGVPYLEYDAPGPIPAGTTFTFPSVTATFTASGVVGTVLGIAFTGKATPGASGAPPVLTEPAGLALTATLTNNLVVPTECAEADPPGPTALASTSIIAGGHPIQPSTPFLQAWPTTINRGGQVKLSVLVTSQALGTPTGSVTFTDVTGGGNKVLGTAPLTDAAASIEVALSDLGEHQITASYGGDDIFKPSTSLPSTVTVTSPSATVVQALYRAVLGREADAGGFAYWAGAIDTGTAPAQVAGALAGSGEGRGHDVESAYDTALDRNADAGGLTFWSGWLTSTGDPHLLLALLQASGEAFAHAGSTNPGYVSQLYQQLLGRPADAGGLAYWTGLLNVGWSRQQVALWLASTGEAAGHAAVSASELVCTTMPSGAFFVLLSAAYQQGAGPSLLRGVAALQPGCNVPKPVVPPPLSG